MGGAKNAARLTRRECRHADMRTLISKTGIARRLDIDPRTVNRLLRESGIQPDAIQGQRKLFAPASLCALRQIIQTPR